MADLQLQQQDPVLGPVLAAWPAKPSNMKERSTRALVQQYPRRFLLKNEILRRRQADQRRGTLEQLILPRRGQGLHQQLREVHCGAMLREKGRRYDAWYGRSVMPCVCMLMGCLKGP